MPIPHVSGSHSEPQHLITDKFWVLPWVDFHLNENFFGPNDNFFGPNSNFFYLDENVFGLNENIFCSNQNIFRSNENIFRSNQNQNFFSLVCPLQSSVKNSHMQIFFSNYRFSQQNIFFVCVQLKEEKISQSNIYRYLLLCSTQVKRRNKYFILHTHKKRFSRQQSCIKKNFQNKEKNISVGTNAPS